MLVCTSYKKVVQKGRFIIESVNQKTSFSFKRKALDEGNFLGGVVLRTISNCFSYAWLVLSMDVFFQHCKWNRAASLPVAHIFPVALACYASLWRRDTSFIPSYATVMGKNPTGQALTAAKCSAYPESSAIKGASPSLSPPPHTVTLWL